MKTTANKYLGIIPARGGSKRIPKKNMRLLGDKPLIDYTIKAAIESSKIPKIIISTDDQNITSYVRGYKYLDCLIRPSNFAQDDTPMIDVVHHAMRVFDKSKTKFSSIILLQPTSPFRTKKHIIESIDLFEKTKADTVTGVYYADYHPYWTWKLHKNRLIPYFSKKQASMMRHELPKAFSENGSIIIVKRSVLKKSTFYGKKIVPYIMDRKSSINIDTVDDLEYAEYLMKKIKSG